MPFDGTDFEPEPKRAPAPVPRNTFLCVVIFLLLMGLLIGPISMDALTDIVEYLKGR